MPAIDWWQVLADPTVPLNYPYGSGSDTHSSETGQIFPAIDNSSSIPHHPSMMPVTSVEMCTSQSMLSVPVDGDGRGRDVRNTKCATSHAPAAQGCLAQSLQQPPPHTGPSIKARLLAPATADKRRATTMPTSTADAGTPVVSTSRHRTLHTPIHPCTYTLLCTMLAYHDIFIANMELRSCIVDRAWKSHSDRQ